MRRLETAIEWIIFNSRWTLAPIYLGLAAALLLLVFHFLKEFIEFALHIAGASSSASWWPNPTSWWRTFRPASWSVSVWTTHACRRSTPG